MTIDFTCQKCNGSFEFDATDLIEGTETIECPHCGAKATKTQNEDFSSAIAEVRTQLAALSKKFAVSMEFETDDLDAAADDDDDDDDDEDDDDDDDDDDDFDDDEDLDDSADD